LLREENKLERLSRPLKHWNFGKLKERMMTGLKALKRGERKDQKNGQPCFKERDHLEARDCLRVCGIRRRTDGGKANMERRGKNQNGKRQESTYLRRKGLVSPGRCSWGA